MVWGKNAHKWEQAVLVCCDLCKFKADRAASIAKFVSSNTLNFIACELPWTSDFRLMSQGIPSISSIVSCPWPLTFSRCLKAIPSISFLVSCPYLWFSAGASGNTFIIIAFGAVLDLWLSADVSGNSSNAIAIELSLTSDVQQMSQAIPLFSLHASCPWPLSLKMSQATPSNSLLVSCPWPLMFIRCLRQYLHFSLHLNLSHCSKVPYFCWPLRCKQ